MEEYKEAQQARTARKEAILKEQQEKAALVADRGAFQLGHCLCNEQGWEFVPHATKKDPTTFHRLCSGTDLVECVAQTLGYYRGERAATAKKD